ncbi:TPA: D-glycero-beta-D-manno-heptose-7-phosphate kinase [bacterium]|nr:D-glycero-beta-D-manno-heptose-7-phosphate kinase [bacterium]
MNNIFEKVFNNLEPVLVVGDLMVDEFIWGNVRRISPEAPVPVVDITGETFHPGGAANVVANIHSLGGCVYVSGVIGDDNEGKRLIDSLSHKGISTEGLIVDKTRPTTLKTRIVVRSQQMIRIDKEKQEIVDERITGQLLDYIKKVITSVKTIVISDYGKGVINQRLLEELIPLAKKHDVITIVDPKIGNFGYYKGVSYITPNHFEAQDLTGIMIKDEASLKACMEAIIRRLECLAVITTRGEEGMSVLTRDGELSHIPTKAKEVYDVTGAGDTVVAILALGLGVGVDIVDVARLANYGAGIVVGKIGTAIVTQEELLETIKNDKV